MRAMLLAAAALAALALGSTAFAQGRIIIVNGNAPGVGFSDPTPAAAVPGNTGTTLGQQRLNVFQYAADTWTSVLNPRVDIYVFARFMPLAAGVLGSAGPIAVSADFPGAEYPGVWYHEALANHLRGVDEVPHDPADPNTDEIVANFSTNFVFYLGLDNNEPAGTSDLLVVVLHELAHGLGFSNLVNEGTGTQFQNLPDVYSKYTLDVTTNKNWAAMTNAERVTSAVNIRNVSWNGLNVNQDVPDVLEPGEPFLRVNSPAGIGTLMFGPAAFGAPLSGTGFTGDVVLADDGIADASTSNACTPLINNVAGKIVLLERGVCTFTVKVKNAQDAGAIAVLAADNVAGAPPPGLGGVDPTITIPSGRITLADGNTLKANLAAGVNVTMALDLAQLAGTDHVKNLMLLATFNPVLLGSSISHFDDIAFPNLIMEPAINPDLIASVTAPEDLTTSLFTDLGWYSDQDGVPDGTDACIGSDTRATVIIGRCNSRVPNKFGTNGCGIADQLDACDDSRPARELACVLKTVDDLKRKRQINLLQGAALVLCSLTDLKH